MGKYAVFLDRDDTLIENVPYLGDPKLVKLMPGASTAISDLRGANFLLIVISNQSGVGRGLITKEQVRSVDSRMEELLGGKNIFATYEHCFAVPGRSLRRSAQTLTEDDPTSRFRSTDRLKEIFYDRKPFM